MAAFDSIKAFLLRTSALPLTALQSIDLSLLDPASAAAFELVRQFAAAASEGDAYAATVCAACYRTGWGALPDPAPAFAWASRAEAMNFAPGVAELGHCHEAGCGTPQDLALALRHLDRASAMGYATAALHLAQCFAAGAPYGPSARRAMRYAEEAFAAGEHYAGYLLGGWFEGGLLLWRDPQQARRWYEKAAAKGSQLASIRLALAHNAGELSMARDAHSAAYYLRLAEAAPPPYGTGPERRR